MKASDAVDEDLALQSPPPASHATRRRHSAPPALIPYAETLHRNWRHVPECLSDIGFYQPNESVAQTCIVSLVNYLQGIPGPDIPRNLPVTPFYVRWIDESGHERGMHVARMPVNMSASLWAAAVLGARRAANPMSAEEVLRCHCEVGVMFDYVEVTRWNDWKAHTNGVVIEFRNGNGWSCPCIVPGAGEDGGIAADKRTKKQRVGDAALAVGYPGPFGDDFYERLRITRFRVAACSSTLAGTG